jgi:hypothetical protein
LLHVQIRARGRPPKKGEIAAKRLLREVEKGLLLKVDVFPLTIVAGFR